MSNFFVCDLLISAVSSRISLSLLVHAVVVAVAVPLSKRWRLLVSVAMLLILATRIIVTASSKVVRPRCN